MRRTRGHAVANWAVGLAAVVGVALGLVLAFSSLLRIELPWQGGFELRAVFANAQSITPGSPVRIAGVNVGEVKAVEHVAGSDAAEPISSGAEVGGAKRDPGAALVTMRISDEGLPVHVDAVLRIRPRLFLEGNYFVDLRPGTPAAPEAQEGDLIPIMRTSSSVQLDQVLSALQGDVRRHLQTVVKRLGSALTRHGGGEALNEFYRASGGAFEATSRVNQALLGTEPHDLSGTIANLGDVVAALNRRRPQLKRGIANLNTVSGALAAEGEALERAVARLPRTIDAARPALAALDGALPRARAFARDALPGLRVLPPALRAGTPLLSEVRALVSERELRGAARDLRAAVPPLVRLTDGTTPLLREARALSSCFNQVVIPWANMTVPDPETPATGRVFEETAYGLVGISGESRSGDANGPYIRVGAGGGTNTVVFPSLGTARDRVVGMAPLPILGARPSLDSSAKTPFRPDVPCERQDPPNLDSGQAAPPPAQRRLGAPAGSIEPTDALRAQVEVAAKELARADRLLDGELELSEGRARRFRELTDDALERLNRALARALGWDFALGGGG